MEEIVYRVPVYFTLGATQKKLPLYRSLQLWLFLGYFLEIDCTSPVVTSKCFSLGAAKCCLPWPLWHFPIEIWHHMPLMSVVIM